MTAQFKAFIAELVRQRDDFSSRLVNAAGEIAVLKEQLAAAQQGAMEQQAQKKDIP